MSVAGSITQTSHYKSSPLSTTTMPPTSTIGFQSQINTNLPDTILNFGGTLNNNGSIGNSQNQRNLNGNIAIPMQCVSAGSCSTTSPTSALFIPSCITGSKLNFVKIYYFFEF